MKIKIMSKNTLRQRKGAKGRLTFTLFIDKSMLLLLKISFIPFRIMPKTG